MFHMGVAGLIVPDDIGLGRKKKNKKRDKDAFPSPF